MSKYHKLFATAVITLAVATVFTGCKKEEKANPEPETTAQTTGAAPVEPEVKEIRSFTTGEKVEKPAYPILVSIPNDGNARPQYGIGQADIVYEMYVEYGITRLLAVFADNMPERVEPVRSARIYTVDIVEDWLGALVHFGGPEYGEWSVYNKFKTANIKHRHDGLAGAKYLTRDSSRSAPNNVMFNAKGYASTLNETPTRQPLKFSETPTAGNTPVNSIDIGYSNANKVGYKYNPQTKKYERYINGKKFIDAADNSYISVNNIVIQEVEKTEFGNTGGSINLNLFGKGKAYFHIDGKMTEGTWERTDRNSSTVYKDLNGNEINLAVGKTFVQIVTDTVKITNN